jgi:hypothetical protein
LVELALAGFAKCTSAQFSGITHLPVAGLPEEQVDRT